MKAEAEAEAEARLKAVLPMTPAEVEAEAEVAIGDRWWLAGREIHLLLGVCLPFLFLRS